MLTQLDLCTGYGCGFPLAGLRSGKIRLIGVAEHDKDIIEVLEQRFPAAEQCGDIHRFKWEKWGIRPDIVTCSPPCQPFSLQGDRKGSTDERDCIPGILKIVGILNPRYFILENVPGILSCPFRPGDQPGTYFARLLHRLDQSGFDAEWQCISSADFGAPFKRERLLLVAVSRGAIKPNWYETAWADQIGSVAERSRSAIPETGIKPGSIGESIRAALGVDRPLGIASGTRTTRNRRAGLGNSLDPRVAGAAIDRLLWIDANYRI